MIEHIVLFKFKPTAPPDHPEQVAAALLALKGVVPGVLAMSCGRNFSERAQGYQLGLVVRLKDKAALAAYAEHPAHVGAIERWIKPQADTVVAVDYEV